MYGYVQLKLKLYVDTFFILVLVCYILSNLHTAVFTKSCSFCFVPETSVRFTVSRANKVIWRKIWASSGYDDYYSSVTGGGCLVISGCVGDAVAGVVQYSLQPQFVQSCLPIILFIFKNVSKNLLTVPLAVFIDQSIIFTLPVIFLFKPHQSIVIIK